MNVGSLLRNMYLIATAVRWSDSHGLCHLVAIRVKFDVAKFHNMFLDHIYSCGFKIEEYDWFADIEFHILSR